MTLKYGDLTNQQFNMLTVKEYVGNGQWNCLCECGNFKKVSTGKLINGITKSCGCHRRKNLINQKFDRLTVIERVEDYIYPSGKAATQWLCQCECGNKTIVTTKALTTKHTRSCGCLHKDVTRQMSLDKRKTNTWKQKDNYIIGYNQTQNKEFYISPEDFEKVKQYNWNINNINYVRTNINNQQILLHRFIMDCPPDKVVDHINRNPLDNRRENLRVVTQKENSANSSLSSRNTSGVKGVNWHKQIQKWRARIYRNGKEINLGYFDTKEKAAEARLQAEKEYDTLIPDTKCL